MTLRDFLLLVMQAASGDRAAIGNVARAIVVAMPLVSVTPDNDGITITAGPLMKPFSVRVSIIRS